MKDERMLHIANVLAGYYYFNFTLDPLVTASSSPPLCKHK